MFTSHLWHTTEFLVVLGQGDPCDLPSPFTLCLSEVPYQLPQTDGTFAHRLETSSLPILETQGPSCDLFWNKSNLCSASHLDVCSHVEYPKQTLDLSSLVLQYEV